MKTLNKVLFTLFLAALPLLAFSQNWVQKSNFTGPARMGAVSFVIGNTGYTGLGRNDAGLLKDFWRYDPQTDTWTAVAPFPGAARNGAAAVVINGKAYVGLGAASGVFYDDWYEYDAQLNTWTQKTSCPNGGRTDCAYFGFDNIDGGTAYIMMGSKLNNENTAEVFTYSQVNNTWTPVNGITMSGSYPLHTMSSFLWNGKAYITGGKNASTIYTSFIEFNPYASSNHWKSKGTNYDMGYGNTSFAVGGKAYACYGDEQNVIVYDSLAGTCITLADPLNFDDKINYPSSFVINGVAYFFGGRIGSFGDFNNKVWTLGTPVSSVNTPPTVADILVTPNPASTNFKVTGILTETGKLQISLSDLYGHSILNESHTFSPGDFTTATDVSNLSGGIYLLSVRFENSVLVKRIQVIH